MFKNLGICAVIALSLLLAPFTFAIEKPTAPTAPPRPNYPEVPAPPDISGVYEVPDRPGMRVRVFAHPANKPTPPPRPGTSPKPSSSPDLAVNSSLVCNLQDPNSSSVIGKAGWKIPEGDITYLLNTSSVPSSVGSGNLAGIVKSGFDQYKSATSNKVNFVQGSNTSVSRARLDGRNIITWARASNGTLGVTYVWYYTSTGQAVEVDTIMNSRYKWTWSNSLVCADNATYDAQNIMTHELGHWLGLTDEYDAANFSNNTMYGYGSAGEVKKNTLTTGDIAGVASIYP